MPKAEPGTLDVLVVLVDGGGASVGRIRGTRAALSQVAGEQGDG